MPPVFGPSSWSNARLWSCALANGIAVSPSQSAKKLISRPDKNSSITTSAPAAPKAPSNIMAIAASASASVFATTTPLPAARPSAFTTIGAPCAHISERLGGVVEAAIGTGRNIELAAEVFGESLGAFKLRRLPARAERLDAGGREI